MNRACLNCKRIITFPDIPLPQNYTQRCNACGFENPISDELDHSIPSASTTPSIEDSWSGTFDSAVDNVFPTSAATPTPTPTPQTAPSTMSMKAPSVTTAQLNATIDQLREELLNMINHKMRSAVPHPHVTEASITRDAMDPFGDQNHKVFMRETRNHVAFRQVLVCTQTAALIQTCENQLREFNFQIQPLTQIEQASKVFSEKNYHLMILDQNFFRGEEGKSLLTRIKQTPIHIRRCQVIILVSPNISSCEPQIFYQWGLDMNIHPRDLEQLGSMVRQLMSLRSQMLGPYMEAQLLG